MKKSFIYLMLILLTLALGSSDMFAQKKLSRVVIGSGGFLNEKTSGNWKVSGNTGQLAIEKRTGKLKDRDGAVYQGFWVPLEFNYTGIDDGPEYVVNTGLSNFPNPATATTAFRFSLPGQSYVTLRVYDVSGNLVKSVFTGLQEQGDREVTWDLKSESGLAVTSGSYMYELTVAPAQMAGSQAFSSYNVKNVMVVVR